MNKNINLNKYKSKKKVKKRCSGSGRSSGGQSSGGQSSGDKHLATPAVDFFALLTLPSTIY